MELELRLRAAVAEQDPGDEFTASVMAAVGGADIIDIRTRQRTRLILLGVLLTLGAAAAMLVLELSNPDGTQEGKLAPQPVIAGPTRLEPEMEASEAPLPPEAGAAESSVDPPAAGGTTGVVSEMTRRFIVLVMPLADGSGEPSWRQAAEAFRAALVAELRRIPDLVLLDSVTTSAAEAASIEYRLTVSSLAAQRMPNGSLRVFSVDGAGYSDFGGVAQGVASPGTQFWPMEARLEVVDDTAPGRSTGLFYSLQPTIGGDGVPLVGACGYRAALRRSSFGTSSNLPPCDSAAGMAAALADTIRLQAIDIKVYQHRLAARLRDPALEEGQRSQAMGALIGTEAESELDESIVEAIADHIRGLPAARRKQQWQQVGATREPGFVQALLHALREDKEEEVRLEILKSLRASHSENKRVMAAIEHAAREDSSQIVRMAARRMAYGEEEWSSYVIATLQDAGLSDVERVQPLLYSSQTAVAPARVNVLANTGQREEAVTLLIRVVRDTRSDVAKLETAARALSLLTSEDRPEVLDMLIEVAKDNSLGMRGMTLRLNAINALMRYPDDPRARKAIEDALAGNEMLRVPLGRQLAPPVSR